MEKMNTGAHREKDVRGDKEKTAKQPVRKMSEYGKQLFEKRCTGCHSLDQDREGPRLRGVYGRQTGTISSFKYSTALQSARITWDDDSLDKWLTDTDSLIADNDMAYRVPKPDERADIIRYLKLVSGK